MDLRILKQDPAPAEFPTEFDERVFQAVRESLAAGKPANGWIGSLANSLQLGKAELFDRLFLLDGLKLIEVDIPASEVRRMRQHPTLGRYFRQEV